MASFHIKGCSPLQGRLIPSGNKNAALPMLAATLLTNDPVVLHHVPDIVDVDIMLRLLQHLGAHVERSDHTVCVHAKEINTTVCPADLCGLIRSSILFAGPLTSRYGSCTLSPPGGDVIGRRRIDTHITGLNALGLTCQFHDGGYDFKASEPAGTSMLLDEASVTATENIIMAATLVPGTTEIYHAACEPHVQDLCGLLHAMGAQVYHAGTNRVTVEGVKALHGCEWTVGPDFTEAASFLSAAVVTQGQIEIPYTDAYSSVQVLLRFFARLGVPVTYTNDMLIYDARQDTHRCLPSDLHNAVPKIEDGPWPAVPSDVLSAAIVLATQREGSMLFFEKMFESRLHFVDQLISMGARIVPCDPHRVLVNGPARLHAAHMASPDIRAGMALVLAALAAEGTSVISRAEVIDRGYENIDQRLQLLGAEIKRQP